VRCVAAAAAAAAFRGLQPRAGCGDAARASLGHNLVVDDRARREDRSDEVKDGVARRRRDEVVEGCEEERA